MGALDDIEFLARSENRVEVLNALSSGPHDRAELHEATEVPRPTVGRIVNEFQARGLVSQNGKQYTISPLGDFLATEFRSLLEGVETMRKLRGVVEWLPTDEFDFTLDHFADATVTTPCPGDPTAPVRRATELTREADHVRIISRWFLTNTLEAVRQRTVNGDQTAVWVMMGEAIDMILDDSRTTTMLRDIITSGQAEFYRYEGSHPYGMAVMDETVGGLFVLDDDGVVQGVIETTDEAVRSWVGSTIEDHRQESEPLSADTLEI